MKKWILLCVLTVGMVLPVQAAPSSKTLLWQNMLLKKIAPMFCSVPGGKLSGMFKITEKECMTTFNYAAQKCMNGIEKIPFYTIEDRYTGQQWGKVIGTCIGIGVRSKVQLQEKIHPLMREEFPSEFTVNPIRGCSGGRNSVFVLFTP